MGIKPIQLFLALTLSATVAACGSQTPETTTPETTTPETTTPETPPANEGTTPPEGETPPTDEGGEGGEG